MSDDAAHSSAGDPFATQKANIRDTVKWMVAAYSGVAAVLIAGMSLSGLGALAPCRLGLAGLSAFGVLLCVFLALSAILEILIGDNFFAGAADAESKNLIDAHPEDVLPVGFAKYDDFMKKRGEVRDALSTARHKRDSAPPDKVADADAALKQARARFQEFEAVTSRLIGQAHLFSLQFKLKRLRGRLATLTGLGVVALVICIWALTPPKPEPKSVSIVIPGASLGAPPAPDESRP